MKKAEYYEKKNGDIKWNALIRDASKASGIKVGMCNGFTEGLFTYLSVKDEEEAYPAYRFIPTPNNYGSDCLDPRGDGIEKEVKGAVDFFKKQVKKYWENVSKTKELLKSFKLKSKEELWSYAKVGSICESAAAEKILRDMGDL